MAKRELFSEFEKVLKRGGKRSGDRFGNMDGNLTAITATHDRLSYYRWIIFSINGSPLDRNYSIRIIESCPVRRIYRGVICNLLFVIMKSIGE